jgi:hypothetical protein
MRRPHLLMLVATVLIAATAAACTSSSSVGSPSAQPSGTKTDHGSPSKSSSPIPVESPVAPESNPPGDIPDSTVFVPYRSGKGGYVVRIPEGWSRLSNASNVAFTDKLNSVSVTWFSAASMPTASSAKSSDVPELRRTQRAFRLSQVLSCAPSCTIPYSTAPISVTLPSGPAVVITYTANSPPNPVTGKQYRLEVLRFEFYRSGEEAALTLSGPVGSDNVDPWRLVSQSFAWR